MRTYAACIPCLINQGLNAVRRLGLGEEKEREIALRSLKFLAEFDDLSYCPAYYAYYVQRIVKEISETEDPFYELKKIANKKAGEILPDVEKILFSAEDKLATALKISAAGNHIDFAIKGEFDVKREVERILVSEFVVWHYGEFLAKLKDSKTILIVGDNAGEIVLDKILVRVLTDIGKEVFYAVKGSPILNDATMEDALEVSMTEICHVIDNGSDGVGTWLEDCSENFLSVFWKVDMVISKGQANFETLDTCNRDIFFLLVAKCDPIASELGGERGKPILKYKVLQR